MPEPVMIAPAEPAEVSRIGDLLRRLAPALDSSLAPTGD